jgi:DNA-directed RNA polymerase subunit beta
MLSVAESSPRATKASARISYARIPEVLPIPNLIELQLIRSLVRGQGPPGAVRRDQPDQGLHRQGDGAPVPRLRVRAPKYTELECRTKDLTFSQPLYVNVELLIKETGEIQRQRVYMGDFPVMTDQGTFIINGAERVVVSQLVRSPGVYYSATEDPTSGRTLFSAKVIPNRGAWLEFETSNKDLLSVKVDRKRKIAATTLLRAVGYETNEEIGGCSPTSTRIPIISTSPPPSTRT